MSLTPREGHHSRNKNNNNARRMHRALTHTLSDGVVSHFNRAPFRFTSMVNCGNRTRYPFTYNSGSVHSVTGIAVERTQQRVLTSSSRAGCYDVGPWTYPSQSDSRPSARSLRIHFLSFLRLNHALSQPESVIYFTFNVNFETFSSI